MKKRYRIAVSLFALCICVALSILALPPPRPGVTKANFDRIEVGMTEAEVDAVFGGHANAKYLPSVDDLDVPTSLSRHDLRGWQGANGQGTLQFDRNGHVEKMRWEEWEQSLLERVCHIFPFSQVAF